MKQLCIFLILAAIGSMGYSQATVKVDGYPMIIELKTDGTYCYMIDPDNQPTHPEFTLNISEPKTDVMEGKFIEKNDSVQIIALNTSSNIIQLKEGKYMYIIQHDNLPTLVPQTPRTSPDIIREE